jgi:iron complex outermembrane receptor protein
LDWVIGANYYKEAIDESDHFWATPISNPTFANSTNRLNPVDTVTHESYSAFGQATWHFDDAFSIVGGLRQSNDTLKNVGTFATGPFDRNGVLCEPFADCIGSPNNGGGGGSKLTYRAGLNFELSRDHLIYASISTGYKAGGFNAFDPKTGGVGPYDPESMTAYELGYKGVIGNGASLNTAFYYYDYSSEQISSRVNIAGSFVIFTSGVPTTLYGWEAEGIFQLTDADRLDASVTLAHSEYRSFNAGQFQNVDWSGLSLDRTPEFTLTAGYTHHWNLGIGKLDAHADFKYSSSYFISDFTTAIQYRQNTFSRSNLLLTYTAPDGRFYSQVFARNLEDNIQATGGGNGFVAGVPDAANVAVTEPRMVGLRVGVNY